jgi:hypothetical protein
VRAIEDLNMCRGDEIAMNIPQRDDSAKARRECRAGDMADGAIARVDGAPEAKGSGRQACSQVRSFESQAHQLLGHRPPPRWVTRTMSSWPT